VKCDDGRLLTSLCLSERQKGYDIDYRSRRCTKISYNLLRQRTSWTGWLLFTSLLTRQVEDDEEYKKHTKVDDDFDDVYVNTRTEYHIDAGRILRMVPIL
jgi:hypothetical protein